MSTPRGLGIEGDSSEVLLPVYCLQKWSGLQTLSDEDRSESESRLLIYCVYYLGQVTLPLCSTSSLENCGVKTFLRRVVGKLKMT